MSSGSKDQPIILDWGSGIEESHSDLGLGTRRAPQINNITETRSVLIPDTVSPWPHILNNPFVATTPPSTKTPAIREKMPVPTFPKQSGEDTLAQVISNSFNHSSSSQKQYSSSRSSNKLPSFGKKDSRAHPPQVASQKSHQECSNPQRVAKRSINSLTDLSASWTRKARRAGGAPVTFENKIDESLPFKYPNKFKYLERQYSSGPQLDDEIAWKKCTCLNGCAIEKECRCQQKEPYYTQEGYYRFHPSHEREIIVECDESCQCPQSCGYRVSQRPRQTPIIVYKTDNKGWCVRASHGIKTGQVVGVYTGKLLRTQDALQLRETKQIYIFDISREDDQALVWQGVEPMSVDATSHGNWTRFISHSCEPNLETVHIKSDKFSRVQPYISFVALEDIPPNSELTFDYNSDPDNPVIKECWCGTSACRSPAIGLGSKFPEHDLLSFASSPVKQGDLEMDGVIMSARKVASGLTIASERMKRNINGVRKQKVVKEQSDNAPLSTSSSLFSDAYDLPVFNTSTLIQTQQLTSHPNRTRDPEPRQGKRRDKGGVQTGLAKQGQMGISALDEAKPWKGITRGNAIPDGEDSDELLLVLPHPPTRSRRETSGNSSQRRDSGSVVRKDPLAVPPNSTDHSQEINQSNNSRETKRQILARTSLPRKSQQTCRKTRTVRRGTSSTPSNASLEPAGNVDKGKGKEITHPPLPPQVSSRHSELGPSAGRHLDVPAPSRKRALALDEESQQEHNKRARMDSEKPLSEIQVVQARIHDTIQKFRTSRNYKWDDVVRKPIDPLEPDELTDLSITSQLAVRKVDELRARQREVEVELEDAKRRAESNLRSLAKKLGVEYESAEFKQRVEALRRTEPQEREG